MISSPISRHHPKQRRQLSLARSEIAGSATQVVSRRTLASPILEGGPAGALGREILRSYGPFVDRVGRPVWINTFKILRFVGVVCLGTAEPFLYVDIPPGLPASDTLTLGPGSVWFVARTFSTNAPSSGFCGLRIKRGSAKFGTTVALDTSPIVIPAFTSLTLSLELDPPAAPTGSGPGADARQAQIVLPAHVTLSFTFSGAGVTAADDASLTAFGQAITMHFVGGAAQYDPALGRVAIPFQPNVADFQASESLSSLATVVGEAAITGTTWSLPVTTATPTTLGLVAGDGGLAVATDHGLTLQLNGRDTSVRCGPCTILVDPGVITMAASTARSANIPQQIRLWNGGELDVRVPAPFFLRFISNAAGLEFVAFQAEIFARLDRPRTINNERFPFDGSGDVALVQTAGGTFALVEATAQQGLSATQAMALKNLLIRTSDPIALVAFGLFAGGTIFKGALSLEFAFHFALPILPDPYATNLGTVSGETVIWGFRADSSSSSAGNRTTRPA